VTAAKRLARAGVDPEEVERGVAILVGCFRRGSKVLIFGNGGSAADAQHVAAELVGRFLRERPPLPAIALTTDTSVLTSLANDFGFEHVFARQVEALGRRGDVAVAISTSGRSPNVLAGVQAARAAGLQTLALVSRGPSPLEEAVDHAIVVPGDDLPAVQEGQLAVEHALCAAVEAALFAPGMERRPARPPKLVEWAELLDLRETWRDARRRVVWTNGVFDLLHIGHLRSFEAARKLGDVLVVGVNADETVRAQKGPTRPIVLATERAELVAALEPVDHVVLVDEATPEAALERLRPDVHAKGADYAEKPIPERALVEAYGGTVELLPLVPGVSTTELVRKLREGDGG
jgi:rfaE bifunctional protein nucleotidyltransferase chain/domain